MEITNRKSIWENLKKFDPAESEDSYIEITEWINGEGYDVTIDARNKFSTISLSYNELEAIEYLIKSLNYNNAD